MQTKHIPKPALTFPMTARKVTRGIVIHCADTPPKMDIGWKEINQWHLQRGWAGCGYHVVIRRDGTIEAARPLEVIGAHVVSANSYTVGVCLVGGKGGKSKDDPYKHFTNHQMESLRNVLDDLTERYPNAAIVGHYELDKGKSCPNFNPLAFWNACNR